MILPGATIGIVGSGQLGRMAALVAKRMGYRVCVYSPTADSPTGQVVDKEFVGAYDDWEQLAQFRAECDVITYEFENIPVETFHFLEENVPVHPTPDAIYATQNRLRERELLSELEIPVATYAPLTSAEELKDLLQSDQSASLQFPAVLKTASFGYDGKGQVKVQSRAELETAWDSLAQQPCLLEERISFVSEFSVIVARGGDRELRTYGPIENEHVNHILDRSFFPAHVSEASGEKAVQYAQAIAEKLGVIGVIAVEFFLLKDGGVLVNEIAPRPHNSGHLTIEGFATSQFEQQIRAICGMPLGSAALVQPVVMVNLLGDVWEGNPYLDISSVVQEQSAFLHLYGKPEPRIGRKMGHVTVLGANVLEAAEKAAGVRRGLRGVTSKSLSSNE